ncbi:hypothetical protein PanWU01x14_321240 [Parasponia andersonii]|uniref:Uncharacterized protein n=1 Tax=Parasponia andersonii TaxID=3476 RepID=A0A2P5ALA2_PARAD|nr:hypothetical protein PanWU01x14_321240 [Parasponia andersonii]
MPRGRPRGSHVISPSAIGPSKVRAESITDPRRSGPVRPQPRQLRVRGPEGLLSGNSGPYLDSWGSEALRVCYLGTVALISTVGRVGSPKDLQTEYNGKQPTAPDPDRAFNAILGRRRRKLGHGSTEEIAEISAHDC